MSEYRESQHPYSVREEVANAITHGVGGLR